jgi:hypothetical protein
MPSFSPACPRSFLIDLSISSAPWRKTAGQCSARSADDNASEKATSVMRTYMILIHRFVTLDL